MSANRNGVLMEDWATVKEEGGISGFAKVQFTTLASFGRQGRIETE